MTKTFDDWINEIFNNGLLCAEYKDKVDDAKSNKQLVDIVMDANGMSYLPEMLSKGIPLSYEIIRKRFSSFINGRYVGQIKGKSGHEYTSAIYCKYVGDIDNADMTLLTLLGCSCVVNVSDNVFIHIYADSNSTVQVNCPTSATAIIEYWGNAEISTSGRVKQISHGR